MYNTVQTILFFTACPAGTYGKSCKDKCLSGYYGKNCTGKCNCSSAQECHRIFGCVCPGGYTGNKCDKGNIGLKTKSVTNFTLKFKSF